MTVVGREPELGDVLFESAPVGLAFLDAGLRYVRLNPVLAEINGLPVEAHLGRSVPELWPDLDPRVTEALQAVLDTGVPIVDFELEAETPADPGHRRAFLHSYRPVRDATGAAVGLNCSVVEVTRLREIEAAERRASDAWEMLASLNARLAAAADVQEIAELLVDAVRPTVGAITSGLFLLDGDEFVGVAAAGYPADVMQGFGRWPLASPSPARDAVESGTTVVFPTLASLGRRFPPLAAAMEGTTGERRIATSPLVVDGTPIGALHVGFADEGPLDARDIGILRAACDAGAQAMVRIRLGEAERRSRRLLAGSVDQMPLGVMVVDERGGIIRANKASNAIWAGTMPAQSHDEYAPYRGYHADGRPYQPRDWPVARSVVTGEVVVDEEIAIDTFAGDRRIISVSSAPIEDEDGTRIGGVVVFADVTERRSAEHLREAFLGMLSHELRTPVTSIYGFSQLLLSRGDRLDADLRRSVIEDLEQASTQLYGIVENLLVLARAERGATFVDLSPVLPARTVPRIVEREAAQWPQAVFTVETAGSTVPVMADEGMLDLMLTNLLGNAAKYAPGPITVSLRAEGDLVRICVRDHGVGLPPDELEPVFDLFRRSAHTARRAPGSGIGLFVVRHLAQAQGGSSWARNMPDGGLEVGFALPAIHDAELVGEEG